MKLRLAVLALLAALVLPFAGWATRPAVAAEALTAQQKTAVEGLIRSYLLEHPELLEEVMTALEKKRADEAALARNQIISEKAGILFNSARQVVLGNPKGDVTVVEFFDYRCGYCKRAHSDMAALLKEDGKIRFVLKEFPVLGPASKEAARVAVAVSRIAPEKYADFHQKLLLGRGEANLARATEVALAIGIDKARLETEMGSPEIEATLDESYALANGLGLTGTPSYVIGNTVVPGAVGYDQLKQLVSQARCGTTTC
ncbi:disulfide bond formation protein DsbA [Prosthecomicrobium hirschii]|uniref:Disulfide bond formation protein DsbA n=1 Tax=Prosthecodimorpha hirschii TaxID=665126 RepID=A0A0P6VM36_9HYPH|nr:DsbA family protein [Prosthecomicrobium hirschii]KPL51218.1 disulfide bond formation protein DsbA [Prosthecomicrobium hirschii]TPQ52879.1 DsbA family protein [Prosthecomicrobium hirschii]